MRYRFLDERTGLLRLDEKGFAVLSYIYRDVEALLADGFVFRRLVSDRYRRQGKEYCTIYQLYDIKADDFTVAYALLDTNLEKPMHIIHEPTWYTKCDNADIVLSVAMDIQVMRYFRDTPHDAVFFDAWCKVQHSYALYPNTEFLVCNPIQYPVRICVGTVLSTVVVKSATVVFTVRENPVTAKVVTSNKKTKQFSCNVRDIPYLRVQRLVKGDFCNDTLNI